MFPEQPVAGQAAGACGVWGKAPEDSLAAQRPPLKTLRLVCVVRARGTLSEE